MGLNENVTYNIMKEKRLYRNTVGVHKGKSSKLLPMRSPNKNKNKIHKDQM